MAGENWDRFLPQFKKKNVQRRKPSQVRRGAADCLRRALGRRSWLAYAEAWINVAACCCLASLPIRLRHNSRYKS